MSKPGHSKWLGLYALLPLMVALMVINVDADLSETWHSILLAATVIAVSALTLAWVDRHPRLVERTGAGLPPHSDVLPATCCSRRLCVPTEDEYQSVPIRHVGMED